MDRIYLDDLERVENAICAFYQDREEHGGVGDLHRPLFDALDALWEEQSRVKSAG